MPPKKAADKKLSKGTAARALIKAQQAAQRAEEERLKREAEEKQRLELLQQHKDAISKLMSQEEARFVAENAEVEQKIVKMKEQLDALMKKEQLLRDERRFFDCSREPDFKSVASLNTYLSVISEQEYREGLTDKLEELSLNIEAELEFTSGNRSDGLKELLSRVQKIIDKHIHDVCLEHILNLDQKAYRDDYTAIIKHSDSRQTLLWLNNAGKKNIVEFGGFPVTISLPKDLIEQRFGIQVLYDASSIAKNQIGGTISIKAFQLPEVPSSSRGWIVRPVLRKLTEFTTSPHDLTISIKFTETVNIGGNLRVENAIISSVENNFVVLNATHFDSFAVSKEADAEYPLKSWCIEGEEAGSVKISLEGKYSSVTIRVTNEGCQLLSPDLKTGSLHARKLLGVLERNGYCFNNAQTIPGLSLAISELAYLFQFKSFSVEKKRAIQVRHKDEQEWSTVFIDEKFEVGSGSRLVVWLNSPEFDPQTTKPFSNIYAAVRSLKKRSEGNEVALELKQSLRMILDMASLQ